MVNGIFQLRAKAEKSIRRDYTHECHEPHSKRLSVIPGPISFTSQLRKMAYPAKPYYNLTHDQPHPTHTHITLKYNCNMSVGGYANLDGSCSQELNTAKSNKRP